jgi:hypothetical protein
MAGKTAPSSPEVVERVYPNIETFLENNDRTAISPHFEATREAIKKLPKAKAEQAKRALAALDHTESLLKQLFDVKDKLLEEAKGSKSRKR